MFVSTTQSSCTKHTTNDQRRRHAEEESLALKNALAIANSRLSKLESLEAEAASRSMEIQVGGHSSSIAIYCARKNIVVDDSRLAVGERAT